MSRRPPGWHRSPVQTGDLQHISLLQREEPVHAYPDADDSEFDPDRQAAPDQGQDGVWLRGAPTHRGQGRAEVEKRGAEGRRVMQLLNDEQAGLVRGTAQVRLEGVQDEVRALGVG